MMEAWKGLPFPAAMSTQAAGIKHLYMYFKQCDGNHQWYSQARTLCIESCQKPLSGWGISAIYFFLLQIHIKIALNI
jgi:hypothetical protein